MKRLFAAMMAGMFYAGPASAQDIAPPEACEPGAPHPSAPEEIEQFAFLIGDYTINLHAWREGHWSPPKPGVTARWNGWYGLEGMAVVDEWYNPDPAQDADSPRGINVRMYDPEAEEWDMMWVATSGRQVQDLRAKMIDGVLTMWQVYPERPDFKATFHIDDEDHWSRISYVKDDGGEWVKQYKLAATRIPCAE
ncbi:hypothetical protein [Hyphococcus luteus]|uniref:DUF1579 domain-containing protein n=1 Tax=Hyphococcus luteus TaxID=2058213 RepID=A0A2S7K310_9PROT|nr:hypothetical protein [Marinicaulis flavus]PQA86894.1 hypothetical protein CW354_15595 [Marinicaulis flavus]